MRILTLHRKKNLRLIVNEIMAAEEVWVIGKSTPEIRKAVKLAKLMNVPVHYNPLKPETAKRLFRR